MKRSAPLERRTPLERGTTPLTRTRTPRPRRLKRPTMDPTMRHQVYVRAGGRCDCCGTPLPGDGWDAHHRQLRSRGGKDTLENLVALLHDHHMRVHANPAAATARGLMVPSWADPAAVPVTRGGGRAWLPRGNRWEEVNDA